MDGVININKSAGMTSHDVVYELRRILSIKKIGHTGTLDPDATGVLPMCVGRATKTADMLTAQNKQYVAEMTLGSATDTQDASGTVTAVSEFRPELAQLQQVISEFVGEQMQIPPMYSAIKMDGKKLYELARQGVEVQRVPRPIEVYRIELLEAELERGWVKLLIDCTKGTYIRTLCHDMGEKMGCHAHMSALCRCKSGRFDLEHAFTLKQISAMKEAEDWSFLIPVDQVFDEYPTLILPPRKARLMCNGVRVTAAGVQEGTCYRVYDEMGKFLTLSKAERGQLAILKTFYQI